MKMEETPERKIKALTASNNCLNIENRQLKRALNDWAILMTMLESMSYIQLIKWKWNRNKLSKRRFG